MTYHRPLRTEERMEIVEALKRGNLSHRDIAKQFKRSQSTVSKLARDAGILPTHRRRRSSAVEKLETTYSREQRVAVADKALSALEDLISSGGLNPREMRKATQALKQKLDARRAEDFPELETSKPVSEESYKLFDERGLPKNLAIVFGAYDAQTARENGNDEQAREAQERVLKACAEEGVNPEEVDWSELWETPYPSPAEPPRDKGPQT